MDVHASPDPLPELQRFLSHFQVRFHRGLRPGLPWNATPLDCSRTCPTRTATPWLRRCLAPASSASRGSSAAWPGMRKTSIANECN
jgi:hypothetical protein